MKKKIISFLLAASMCAGFMPAVNAANENWRDPFVTRIMKVISQDPSYTDVVLTDLDRNGIPEAFVIKKGTYGKIGSGFTMVNNVITEIQTPTNIIGECLENINVYIKNDSYIFVGEEVPRYLSQISYYKLTLADNKLTATRINKKDVSPYANVTYVDKYSNNLLENGYPNRSKISEFISKYDVVNNISALLSSTNIRVNGETASISGYSVDDSNYYKVRDIAMLLRQTSKKFNVVWDSELEAIRILPGADYEVIGGEFSKDTAENIEVVENDTPIYVNDRQRAITAYNINGSSYFKIRDIADAVGFDIQWDGDTQTINIITD
ncbi:MAG: hypothetical protein J1G06_00805 [Oscillospiraceae bacterium]|nr:hypothetical protein [Oscillospiraceae bacterium]